MPAYRLYRLDGAGKIMSADWIAADSDDEAVKHVHAQIDGARFELWDRKRLIAGTDRKS